MKSNIVVYLNVPRWCKLHLYEYYYDIQVVVRVPNDAFEYITYENKFQDKGRSYIEAHECFKYDTSFNESLVHARKQLENLRIIAKKAKVCRLVQEIDELCACLSESEVEE